MAIVISGFPGVGKSTLYQSSSLRVSDSDSSGFDKANFPHNYVQHIKQLLLAGQHDVILVSSHEQVRQALQQASIPYCLVYPCPALEPQFLRRYEARGSSPEFIKLVKDNWDQWQESCVTDLHATHYVLNATQPYLDEGVVGELQDKILQNQRGKNE